MTAPNPTSPHTARSARLRGRLLAVVLACLGILGAYTIANGAVNGDGTMTVATTSVAANSTGNVLAFTFTNNSATTFSNNSSVTVDIPVGWTAPTLTSTNAGFVSAANVGAGTCVSAGAVTLSGRTVTVAQKCPAGASFILTYGGPDGTSKVTAPVDASSWTFTTKSLNGGSGAALVNIASQPTITTTLETSAPTVTWECSSTSPTTGYASCPTADAWLTVATYWVRATVNDGSTGSGLASTLPSADSQSPAGSDISSGSSTCDSAAGMALGPKSCVFVWARTTDTTSGGVTYTVTSAADRQGNVAETSSHSFKLDKTAPNAPTVTCSDGAACGGSTWSTASSVTLTASGSSDNAGGSGFATYQYRTSNDGSTWTGWIDAETHELTAEGRTFVQFRAVDAASNASAATSTTVQLDRTAPAIAWSCSTTSATANDFTTCATWYRATVWVKATVTDAASGLSVPVSSSQLPAGADATTVTGGCAAASAGATSCVVVWRRATDTASSGVIYSVTATDRAAQSTSDSRTVGRDTVAPAITWTNPATTTKLTDPNPSSAYAPAWTATDTGSDAVVTTASLQRADVCDAAAWTTTDTGIVNESSVTLHEGNCYRFVATATDTAGNRADLTSATVKYPVGGDNDGPTGSISVNTGADATNGTSVRLSVSATDVGSAGMYQMRFSNDGSSWSAWEAYGTTKAWTLAAGDGAKTVYAQFTDRNDNTSGTVSDGIVLDTVAPTGSIVVNGGNDFTNGTGVTLTLAASDGTGTGVTQMKVRNALGGAGSWAAYASSADWTLANSDGTRTVYVQYQDAAGNLSTEVLDTVLLDRSSPTVIFRCGNQGGSGPTGLALCSSSTWYSNASLAIQAAVADTGAGFTSAISTTDARTATDLNLTTTYSTCLTAVAGGTSCNYLWVRTTDTTSGGMTYTVTVADRAGNATTVSQTVKRDATAPAITSFLVNNGDPFTTSPTLTLSLAASDGTGSGVNQMQFSTDNSTWTTLEAFGPSKSLTISSGDGVRTIYARVTDNVALTATASRQITLDTTAPSVAWACATTAAPVAGDWTSCGASWYAAAQVWARATITDGATGLAAAIASSAVRTSEDVDLAASTCDDASAGTLSCTYVWKRVADTTSGGITYSVTPTDVAGFGGTASTQRVMRDATAPTGTITIAGGAAATNTRAVSLSISASDGTGSGVTLMRVATNLADLAAASFKAYATTDAINLVAGADGIRNVYVQFRDAATNTSLSAGDTILYDITSPTVTYTCATTLGAPTASDWGTCAPTSGWFKDPTVWVRATVADAGAGVALGGVPTATDLDSSLSTCDDLGGASCDFVWARTADTVGQTYSVTVSDGATNAGSGSQTIKRDTVAPTGASVVVNGDAEYTANTSVSLGLSATDGIGYSGVAWYSASNDGDAWSAWLPYASSVTWTVTTGDATKTVRVQYMDAAGNVTATVTDQIIMDATPPTATVTINGGATYTKSTAATLAITGSDGGGTGVTSMRVSADGGATYGAWTTFSTSAPVTLTTGDGVKTVRVEVRDLAGAIGSATATIILDQAGPTTAWSCSTTGATAADFSTCSTWYRSTVWVKATITDAETGLVSASAAQSPAGSDLVAGSSTCASLGAGTPSCTFVWSRSTDTTSGGVTYSVTASDVAANAATSSTKNVKRDTVAPTGVSIVVAANAAATATGTVSLAIAATDGSATAGSGLATMRLRNEVLAWNTAVPYATSVANWALSATDGAKTVWVEVSDLAGNVTSASDGILLDTTAPTGTLAINGGADFTSRTAVALSLAVSDGAGSGLSQMRFMNDGSAWTTWEAYATTKAWTLPGEGTRIVRAEVRDAVGNVASLSDGITVATGSTITFGCALGATPTDVDFGTCWTGWYDGTPLTIRAVVVNPFAGLATATASGATLTDLSTGESTCDDVTAGQTSCVWTWKRTTDTTSGGVNYSVTATDLAGNATRATSTAVKRDGTPVAATWSCAVKTNNQPPATREWAACTTPWYGSGSLWVKATISDALSGLNSGVIGGYAQSVGTSDLVTTSSTCQSFTAGMASCDFVWRRTTDTTSGGVAYLVTAPDAAGNAGTARQTVRRDTTGPSTVTWACATATDPTAGDFAACPTTGWLGGTTATIRATLTDTGSGFGTAAATGIASATDLSPAYSTCDDITAGTAGVTSCVYAWRRTAETASTGVTYSVAAAADLVGNAGTASNQTVRRDATAPAIAWACSTTSATSGFGACLNSGYQTTIWVRATVTDATAGIALPVGVSQSEAGSDLDAATTTCSTIASGATACQVVWARTADTTSGGITYAIAVGDAAGNRTTASQTVLKGRFGPDVTWSCSTVPGATSADYGACDTNWYTTDGLWVKATLADTGGGISASSTATATDLVAGQSTCSSVGVGATTCDFVWYHAGGTVNGGLTYQVTAVDTLGRSGTTTTTIKIDVTAPVAGLLVRTPALDATAATSTTVELTGATDPESAIATTVLRRTSYPLVDGVCAAAASTVDVSVGAQVLATGACYSWSALVANGAGLTATTAETTPLKVDATPPSAPAAPLLDHTGMTSVTSVTLGAGAPGTDGESGVVSTLLYMQLAPFAAAACGTYGPSTLVPAGAITLTTATCYSFHAVSTNGTGLHATGPAAVVMVDTTPPSAPGTPLLETTAAFLGTTTIPVSLTTLGLDPESGTTTILHRESAPLALGVCGTFDTQELASDPAVSGRCYRFYAVATNGAGLTAQSGTTAPVRVDTTGPLAPVAPTVGAVDATSTTLTITAWSPGTDPESGIMVSALYRRTAPLAGGVCGTWDLGTVFSTAAAPVSDTVAGGSCYQYYVLTINNAGVSAESPASTPVKVDGSAPVVTATTATPSGFTSSTSITILAGAASDPESGVVTSTLLRRVAILSGGSCLAYGDPIEVGTNDSGISGFCYVYFVRATNGAGATVDGPASAPVKVDTSAPTGIPGVTTTTPTGITSSTSVALAVASPGSDPESGIASHTFYRKLAPLTNGVCGVYGTAVAVGGTTDSDGTAGCRVYFAKARNGAGAEGSAGSDSAPVMVDTTPPTAAAAPTTTPTGPTDLTTISITPGAAGTDAESGVASSQLWRTSAVLLSGVCQAYGNDVTAATTDTVAGGSCYRYYVKTTNRAGLVSTGTLSAPVIVSSQTPVVMLDLASSADTGTPGDRVTSASPLAFTVRFDRSVTDVAATDFSVSGGGCSVTGVTGDTTTYTVTVAGCTDGAVTLTFAADGAAVGAVRGPVTATSSPAVTLDRTAPTVTSFTTPLTSLSDATSVAYSLVFSEPVAGLATGDLTLAGSTSAGWTVASVSGSGASYTVTLTGSAQTAGTIALALAAGSVADVAGNTGPAAAATASAVTYAPVYTITASAGANGTISPSGAVPVSAGGSQVFTFSPAAGYRVGTVTLDGLAVATNVGSYTVANVTGPRSISVTFERVAWSITASAGSGGTISPSGTVSVLNGDATTFTIAANAGWHVLDVIVDSVSVGPQTSYTFSNVTGSHSISATFAQDAAQTVATTTTIAASASTVLVGQPVTLTATVAPSIATGTVSFWDGSSALQSCTIVAGGSCSITVSSLLAGTHDLRATFNGNSLYLISTSAPTTVVVGSSTGNTTTYDYPVTAGQVVNSGIANGPTIAFAAATDGTATVTIATATNPVSAGSTPFVIGGGTVFYEISAAMADGSAAGTAYQICLPGASPDRLWHYEAGAWRDVTTGYGSGTVCGETTSLSPFAVGAQKTTTASVTLSVTPGSLTAGGSVTLAASVTPSTATGTVTFRAGATTLATCQLTAGSCSTSVSPAAGTYEVVADYAGDGTLFGATSAASTLTVSAASGGGGGGFGGGVVAPPSAQTIVFAPATTLAVGATITLSAVASSGLPVTYATTTPAICSVTGALVKGLGAGSCSITATQVGDGSYAAASETRTITVGGAAASGMTTRAYLGTTLLATNPAKVASGKTVTLRLVTSKAYAGRSVGVWRRIGTSGTWTKVTSKTISSTGRAAYSFTVTRSDVAYRFILKTSTTSLKGTAIRVIRK